MHSLANFDPAHFPDLKPKLNFTAMHWFLHLLDSSKSWKVSSKLVVNHWRLPRVELRSRRRSKIRPNRLPGPSISTSREENAIPGKMFDVFTGNGNPRFGFNFRVSSSLKYRSIKKLGASYSSSWNEVWNVDRALVPDLSTLSISCACLQHHLLLFLSFSTSRYLNSRMKVQKNEIIVWIRVCRQFFASSIKSGFKSACPSS